jgi:hypothetical protein
MNNNKIIHRFPVPENRIFWLCVMLFLKFGLLYILVKENRPTLLPETIAVCSGDCDSYLGAIDNYIEYGKYEPDFRMPGYGFPYYLFRLVADKNHAVNLLIVFQTALDAIAAVLLSLALYWITRRRAGFYLGIILYGVGISVSCYNNWILTESMTSSMLVFGFYFLVKYWRERKQISLFFAGIFITWSYFLRPINITIVIFFALTVFFIAKQRRLSAVLLFLIPAVIINTAWSARNYIVKGKPYLLTENLFIKSWYGDYGLAGLNFCQTFSDWKITYNFFENGGLNYFGQAISRFTTEDIKIPDEIYTPDFNFDSLKAIQQLYKKRVTAYLDQPKRITIEDSISAKFIRYTASIKKYHPYIVYLKTPMLLTKSFILQGGVHNLFFMPYSYQPFYRKLIKLFFIIIYVLAFALFVAGFLFYRQLFDNKLILLSCVIAFYLIFIHSIFLRSIEPRYIIPAYPFFVIGAVFTVISVLKSYNIKILR